MERAKRRKDYKATPRKYIRANGKDPMHWFMIGGCAVIVVLALVIIVKLAQGGTFGGSGNARVASASEAEVQETVIGETLPEDEEQAKEDERKKNVVSPTRIWVLWMYLVILICVRAPVQLDVIGKLMGGSAYRFWTIPRKAGIRYLPAVWRAGHQFRICTDWRGGKNRGI